MFKIKVTTSILYELISQKHSRLCLLIWSNENPYSHTYKGNRTTFFPDKSTKILKLSSVMGADV